MALKQVNVPSLSNITKDGFSICKTNKLLYKIYLWGIQRIISYAAFVLYTTEL